MTNNSIIFENDESGEAEKALILPDIEQSIHLNLVLLLKNGQKEIISVKDYVKSRFLVIPDYKTQSSLSNRILTFIAENYEQVFVPDILLTKSNEINKTTNNSEI